MWGNIIYSRWIERALLDNGTILICSARTNIYRSGSTKESITHVVRPLTMYIENLEEGPFALLTVWALHRPTKATASLAHWNSGPFTVLQIQFKKAQAFSLLSFKDKRMPLAPASRMHTLYSHNNAKKTPKKNWYIIAMKWKIATFVRSDPLHWGQTYSIIHSICFTCILFSPLNKYLLVCAYIASL